MPEHTHQVSDTLATISAMGVAPTPWQERFWRYLTPGAHGDCWEWQGARNSHGYGRLNSGGKNGRTIKAHRASYEIHHGVAPGDMDVCHHCDNPPCCNPAHLFLGDAATNAQDMARKGRAPAQNGQVLKIQRITDGQVIDLRERAAAGESYEELGAAFGIAAKYAGMIANGRFRAQAGGPLTKQVNSRKRFTDQMIVEMRERAAAGEQLLDIAAEMGTSRQYVGNIVRGRLRAAAGGPIRT